MSRLKIFLLLLFLASGCNIFSQKPAFLAFENDPWVSATLQKMTLQEKIGQLIMIDVYPGQDSAKKNAIGQLIQKYKPGGILILCGSPVQTVNWINDLQSVSGIPLFTAIDGESGPGFRLDSVLNFPGAQSLGAVQNDELIQKMGRAVGKQLRALGINMNFAPVADVNTNPQNPVINIRSFGEDRDNVARKAIAFTSGLQQERIAAVAKHFPGHGDTDTDSHLSLPLLDQSAKILDSLNVYPFKQLADKGIAGMMTGHLNVPAYDPSGKPASLSGKIINEILKDRLGFKGLVVTDAMNMKGVSRSSGKSGVLALQAGNDMLEFVKDLPGTVSEIEKAVSSGALSIKEIDGKCRKILALKRWLGLNDFQPADLSGLPKKLNLPGDELIQRELTEGSLTVLKNDNVLPLKGLNTLHIATVAIGEDSLTPFQKMADRYTDIDHFFLKKEATPEEVVMLTEKLKSYNLVIAGVLNIGNYPRFNYRTTAGQQESLKQLVNQNRVVTLFFGNAYALQYFPEIEKSTALVLAYQSAPLTQELAVQLVFGALNANGKLPVTASAKFPAGSGVPVTGNRRFKYTIPEETAVSSEFLNHKIDSIANEGLLAKAYPGCQVLIARNGKVILHRCYGYLTYENKEPVTPDKLYDFASVTKVSGPLPLIIKLTDEGRFDLDKKMSDYLPLLLNSNKENIVIRDVLAHQAQLPAIIPFWNSQLAKNRKLREKVFTDHPVSATSVRVSSRLWMEHRYVDTMYQEIRKIPLLKAKKYNYTCMGFTLWPLVIQNITQQPYETYLKSTIYKPLGATTLTYNPYQYFPVSRMVPTESDDYFRKEVLRGFVHDEGAAMLGGVSGNAGLFGTVNDLAKLFQMYLWKGYYGGDRFFSEKTFDEFNTVQFPENGNRRALGFDKPFLDNALKKEEDSYHCKSEGIHSFGHTGYTGTFVWADPDQEFLVIVFTNRVQPTRNNDLLSNLKIRAKMLQAVYDAIERGNP
jgi:beta-N-acetylhexosaminidase